MPLVSNGQIIADQFVRVLDDAPLPANGGVLIPAERLLSDPALLDDHKRPVGVLWPNNRNIGELAPYIDRLAMVALVFPNFRDGRGYSQARLLRERYGFDGELRATGEVLRDQFLFLVRAGFDTFEVAKDKDAQAFVAALDRFSVFYQPTGVSLPFAGQLRQRRNGAAQNQDRLQAVG